MINNFQEQQKTLINLYFLEIYKKKIKNNENYYYYYYWYS